MAISENDKKRILYPFERTIYSPGYTGGNHNYDSDLESRMFGTSINLNIVEGKVECPTFIIGKLYVNLPTSTLETLNSICVPLYSRFSKNIKTVSSVINAGFDKVQWCNRLMKVIMPNEEIYYINKGIILDKDMNPIIVYTWNCNITDKSYDNPKVYVNPIVFTKMDLPLYKDIVNKFIANASDFEIVEISSKLQHENLLGTNLFLPDISGGLVFYVAKLKRVK